jgi:hypothetical protein
MTEQRIDSAYKYAMANNLHTNYVISAVMIANFKDPMENTIKQLNPPLEHYSNPLWAVTLTKEPDWMPEIDFNMLPPTTDERAINYMNNKF